MVLMQQRLSYRALFLRTMLILSVSMAIVFPVYAAQLVSAARVWPAQDYTRITLESNRPFVYRMLEIKNPDRIVLDIENVVLDDHLKSLASKILPNDPYIKQIRLANYQQNIVRLVIDLKEEAKPKAINLAPAGEYQHRLVLDVFPLKDPLMNMLAARESSSTEANPSQDKSQSTVQTQTPQMQAEVNAGEQQVIYEPLPATKQVEEASSESVSPQVVENAQSTTVVTQAKSKTKNKTERQIIIAIDAGHGGEDPGARGANGSHEKDITLKIAKKLKAAIDNEPSMQGVLTRDADYFIPLHGRVVKARNSQADLFVSIHADAFTNQAARGSSVFALSERGATSAGARYLAKKENESDLIGGVSLDDKDPLLARTLLDLSQTATINDSLKLGKAVLTHIGQINKLHKNQVEQAGFAVLKSPDIPSILVETAFISNPEEERKLNDDDYQDKLVNSILAGIRKYFSANPALAKAKLAKE
jgi:N-acetylmuramoyl-L-alanine amidase